MTLTIRLSDEQARALEAKAAAEGLSVEEWIQRLAEPRPADRPLETAAEIILSSMRDVPPEIMATMPRDGASQHDHYIYGWPKKEA
jgi:LmbE family N-acetylglucosaminyl deacetylase